jgi:hypothetical protein
MSDLLATEPGEHPDAADADVDHESHEEPADPARWGCQAGRRPGCYIRVHKKMLRCDGRDECRSTIVSAPGV